MDTNANTLLHFLGWAALTYTWLSVNCAFFEAIADAIHHHNKQIKQKAIADIIHQQNEQIRQRAIEDESESEIESEDEEEQ